MPADIQLARKRFAAAKAAWSDIRQDAIDDLRFVSGDPATQWEADVKAARDEAKVPALSFDRLHPLVQQITNQARQNRPQPKVNPGDDGNPETAEMLEGKMRHIMYVSHADVAFDNAVVYQAAGGFGFYRVVLEYTDDKGFNQEPRIKRIKDPFTIYYDPDCQEPDFSDAKVCFARKRYQRDAFKAEFHKEPMGFPFEEDRAGDWGDEEHVWVAEYWHLETRLRKLLQLTDGTVLYADQIDQEIPEYLIANQRDCEEREIWCDIIDGEKVLESTRWVGDWIPIIPVLGWEITVEGKRKFVSVIRYSRDPQRLLNASVSGVAAALGTASDSPWVGPKGSFRDPKWRDGKRHPYREWDAVLGPDGRLLAEPHRDTSEPAIQALVGATALAGDAVKASVGYVDNVTRPSQAELSGVAVKRRDAQVSLANWHIMDNLASSQYHLGRILLDLIRKTTDTPRLMRTMKEDGTTKAVPVAVAGPDGSLQGVPGRENEDHYAIGQGQYDVTITTGPGYASRRDEERDVLMQVLQANPNAWPLYSDLVFKLMGYTDLEERAKLGLPPQIQQAIAGGQDQKIPPAVAAQMMQLTAQNQQLQQVLQQVLQKLNTKAIETQGKLDVEKLKTIRALIETSIQHQHEAGMATFEHQVKAAGHLADLMHQTELAPDPNATEKVQ